MWFCVALCSTRSRNDVTKSLVLTRIRQDTSAGTCVAGMISLPRQHTPHNYFYSATIANFLRRARMLWIIEHPRHSRMWNEPKIQGLAAQLRTSWASSFFALSDHRGERDIILFRNVDNRVWHHIDRRCVGTDGRCSASGCKHAHPNASTSRCDTHFSI